MGNVWQEFPNPFTTNRPEVITGHVSGRRQDIISIINSEQKTLILAGTPSIGKTTLIRYLQVPPEATWSWRQELQEFRDQETLDGIRFVSINLKRLEEYDNFQDTDTLLRIFIEECTLALYQAYRPNEKSSSYDLSHRGLYKLLRTIENEAAEKTCYFLTLDNIERLGNMYISSSGLKSQIKTPQEHGIALLDRCRAIRTIVDLVDEFKKSLGFILSIKSLPRARITDQFTNISADLARFLTKTLQTFTWEDSIKFLDQKFEDFQSIANNFNFESDYSPLCPLFSPEEQEWLLELTGTHPYLLQQACYNTFQYKAYITKGVPIAESHKTQFIGLINEQVAAFLSNNWKRLQEALKRSANSDEIEKQFYAFISLCVQHKTEDELDLAFWDSLDPELRYILYSEGIVRFDPGGLSHFPGSILREHLVQQAIENNKLPSSVLYMPTSVERSFQLHITRPGSEHLISLSRLEYRLLKTLVEHAEHCSVQELILAAWGSKAVDRSTFTQRLHKLRKKLEAALGEDPIINTYGGNYSLSHAEWFQFE